MRKIKKFDEKDLKSISEELSLEDENQIQELYMKRLEELGLVLSTLSQSAFFANGTIRSQF